MYRPDFESDTNSVQVGMGTKSILTIYGVLMAIFAWVLIQDMIAGQNMSVREGAPAVVPESFGNVSVGPLNIQAAPATTDEDSYEGLVP